MGAARFSFRICRANWAHVDAWMMRVFCHLHSALYRGLHEVGSLQSCSCKFELYHMDLFFQGSTRVWAASGRSVLYTPRSVSHLREPVSGTPETSAPKGLGLRGFERRNFAVGGCNRLPLTLLVQPNYPQKASAKEEPWAGSVAGRNRGTHDIKGTGLAFMVMYLGQERSLRQTHVAPMRPPLEATALFIVFVGSERIHIVCQGAVFGSEGVGQLSAGITSMDSWFRRFQPYLNM